MNDHTESSIHIPIPMRPAGEVAGVLRDRRIRKGLSQEDVAVRSGLSMRTVCDAERGDWYPGLATTVALCRALGITVETLCSANYQDHPRVRGRPKGRKNRPKADTGTPVA